MKFSDLYKKYGSDLRQIEGYKGICRELSLLSPASFLPLLEDYLKYFKINIFDFINKEYYNNLIYEDMASNKKVDMAKKLFGAYYLYLKNLEKKARSMETDIIKKLTWG